MAATEERKIEQLNVEEAIEWMKSNFTGVDMDSIETRMKKYHVNGADLLAMEKEKLEMLLGEINKFKVDTFFNTIHAAAAGRPDTDDEIDLDIQDAKKYQFSDGAELANFLTSQAWLTAFETAAQQVDALEKSGILEIIDLDKLVQRRMNVPPQEFDAAVVKMILDCLDDDENKAQGKWKDMIEDPDKMRMINEAIGRKLEQTPGLILSMSLVPESLQTPGRKKKGEKKRSDVCAERVSDYTIWNNLFGPEIPGRGDDEKTRATDVRGEDTSTGRKNASKEDRTKRDKPDLTFWWKCPGMGVFLKIELKSEEKSGGIQQLFRNCVHQAVDSDPKRGIRAFGVCLLIRGKSSLRVGIAALIRNKLRLQLTKEVFLTSLRADQSVAELFLALKNAHPRSLGWFDHPEGYKLFGCVGQGAESVVIQATDNETGSMVVFKYYRNQAAFNKAVKAYEVLNSLGISYENRSDHCFDCPKKDSWNPDEWYGVFDYHFSSVMYAHPKRFLTLADDLTEFHDLEAAPVHCDISPHNLVLDIHFKKIRVTDVGSLRTKDVPASVPYTTTPLLAPSGEPTSKKWDQTMLLRTVQCLYWQRQQKTVREKSDLFDETNVQTDLDVSELKHKLDEVITMSRKVDTPACVMQSSDLRGIIEPMDVDNWSEIEKRGQKRPRDESNDDMPPAKRARVVDKGGDDINS